MSNDERSTGFLRLSSSLWGRLQYSLPPAVADLRIGLEGESVGYHTRCRNPADGALLSKGEGNPRKLSTHAELTREIAARVKIHAGVRYDRVRPEEKESPGFGATVSQWSPRLALNLEYAQGPSASGNLFLTWTRAFKAPTLEQLFDVRAIPTGVLGEDVLFANASLQPQRSSSVEAGVHHRLPLGAPERFRRRRSGL